MPHLDRKMAHAVHGMAKTLTTFKRTSNAGPLVTQLMALEAALHVAGACLRSVLALVPVDRRERLRELVYERLVELAEANYDDPEKVMHIRGFDA